MHITYVRSRLDVIEKHIKNKNVLDLGCADARPNGKKKYRSTGLHEFVRQHSKKVLGIDLDLEGVTQLRADGYNVVCGDVEEINLNEKFDCIVAGEIIEHLSNPGKLLKT